MFDLPVFSLLKSAVLVSSFMLSFNGFAATDLDPKAISIKLPEVIQ